MRLQVYDTVAPTRWKTKLSLNHFQKEHLCFLKIEEMVSNTELSIS